MLLRRVTPIAVAVLMVLAWAGSAGARGGKYVFDGGTLKQQAQVRVALAVSSFNWSIGGKVWSHTPGTAARHGPDHVSLGAERFASTLAWSYWQSPANSLKPTSKKDESAAMAPARFRALLEQMLGARNPVVPVVTVG